MPRDLRIGVPSKGRLSELASELVTAAGLSFRRQERSLFARVRELPAEVTFLRTDDIPVLVSEGAIDLGITGGDLLHESGVSSGESSNAEVLTRLALGVGHCRLAVCVPDESPLKQPSELDGKHIATSFPNATRQFLEGHGAAAHLVELTGSVEVMVALGVADAIVDLVDTGSTLAANHLRVLAEIGSYETILIQHKSTPHAELCDRITRRLEGVVIARAYSLLEYNVSADKLQEAERITPGFNSPTISKLEEEGWMSVRAMVKRRDVIEVMERLEQLGATAILETQIVNCRL